jgi:hypothetical protein
LFPVPTNFQEEQQADEEHPPPFAVSLDLGVLGNRYACLAFIKRGSHLIAEKDLASQLRVLSLSEGLKIFDLGLKF